MGVPDPALGDVLEAFDPDVADWFRATYGVPTEVQAGSWRQIRAGRHVLAVAPTGSGKTLAAFLWALDALISGRLACGETRVLYLSPLKALNTDIARNLVAPLEELRGRFLLVGRTFPDIRVATRSGDTSPSERRRHVLRPPEILATTPESLALILNSPRSRSMLSGVKTVILDEIHALEGEKRGVFLMTSVERLTLLAGEFQRIALSATVADRDLAAAFAAGSVPGAGSELSSVPGDSDAARCSVPISSDCSVPGAALELVPRSMQVVEGTEPKAFSLTVAYPPPPSPGSAGEAPSRWTSLTESFVKIAESNRSTLIFVNSRRHAEKIAFLMNETAGKEVAWAHHGSLSREVRSAVEERLKAGELPAVAATSSLELGIDIGSIDEVVLAGTPASVASAIQRVGRSGHRVGAESRAVIFPIHELDLLFAAALAVDASARPPLLERIRVPENPLDILVQELLAMCAMDEWQEDELYAFVRRVYSFRKLPRDDFDRALRLLRGRYDSGRVAALSPRLKREESAGPGLLVARPGALPLLYRSGGTIPDRGSYALVQAGSRARIGDLDEEFVWERRIGDSFALGSRSWRIVGIDDRTVTVAPGSRGIDIVPFWRAEGLWRSDETMRSVRAIADLARAEADQGRLRSGLAERVPLDDQALDALCSLLLRQRSAAGLPGERLLIAERFRLPEPAGGPEYAFLHTLRGGRTNGPLAIALRALTDERWGAGAVDVFWDDVGILFSFPGFQEVGADGAGTPGIEALLTELSAKGLEGALRSGLESTGLFGAAFREAAGRALLLPKGDFGSRTPLWLTRLRAKRLYEAVRGYPDFPLVKEAWRTCLFDWFDLEGAAELLSAISAGVVAIEEVSAPAPSPLARGSVWIAGNDYVYRRDDGSPRSSLSDADVASLFGEAELHRYDEELAAELSLRAKRLAPDYLPRNSDELLDWLDERRAVPLSEWAHAVAALSLTEEDLGSGSGDSPAAGIGGPGSVGTSGEATDPPRLFRVPGASETLVLPRSGPLGGASVPWDAESTDDDGEDAAAEGLASLFDAWFAVEGPVEEARILSIFGPRGLDWVRSKLDDGAAVVLENAADERRFCEALFASRLLVAQSRKRRSEAALTVRPLATLQAAAADRQGIAGPTERASPDLESRLSRLRSVLEPLLGLSLPGEAWERDVLPARMDYDPVLLDLLASRAPLVWYGAGAGRIGFALEDELALSDLESHGDSEPPGEFEVRLLGSLRRLSSPSAFGAGPGGEELLKAGGSGEGTETAPFGRGVSVDELSGVLGISTEEVSVGLSRLAGRGLARSEPLSTFRTAFSMPRNPQNATTRRDIPFGSYRPRRDFPSRSRWERSRWERWKETLTTWYPLVTSEEGPLERDRADRERCRRLLDRYGMLCRSVAALDERPRPWPSLFWALRLMELAGETVGGRFYAGLDELQFVYARDVAAPAPCPRLYALCATDPASLCGLAPLASALSLPPRIPSAHLVWNGADPVLISRRNGRDLDFRTDDDRLAGSALAALVDLLLTRTVSAPPSFLVETIGGVGARLSPFAELLGRQGFRESLKGLEFERDARKRG